MEDIGEQLSFCGGGLGMHRGNRTHDREDLEDLEDLEDTLPDRALLRCNCPGK